ncbi:hypothetical protein [Rothia halotolerans]|uniref:hypothetical protein n=1 Tax=Rothia halotolerans TaxID=405770 RepID=UPI00101CB5F5|nr:hypothetical protein [Rothia halotolerans]
MTTIPDQTHPTTEKENSMSTNPSLIVSTSGDVQSLATRRYLDAARVPYATVTAESLSVLFTDREGSLHQWAGHRADRLAAAVADFKAAAA